MKTTNVLGLGLALSLAACASQKPAAKEDPLQAKVERLFPQPDSLDGSKIAIKVAVYNPTSKPVTLQRIEYEVDSGDVAGVVKGSVDISSDVESQQVAEAEFTVDIPFPKGDAEAYKAILERETVALKVSGTAVFAGGTRVTFERQGAVATPSLPKFVVHDAQAARYGREGLDMTFFLRLINENAFTVTVGEVEYAVEIYGKKLKEQTAAIGVTLVAGAAQEFEVSVVLEEKTFEGITQKLKSGSLEYRVYGTVSVNDVEAAFEQIGSIDLDMD